MKRTPQGQRAATSVLRLSAFLLLSLTASAADLAVVIDDVGNQHDAGLRALALPGPLNIAVLPQTPFAAELARKAHASGHEVLLHAPMASEHSQHLLGPGALAMSMDEATLRARLRENLRSIPFVRGFNNHMGSEMTADVLRMRWVLREASAQGVYFLDSRTTLASMSAVAAMFEGARWAGRDVFLDHEATVEAVRRQWRLALAVARKQGRAVAIGHPKPATLSVLAQELPKLAAEGIRLVPVSALVRASAGNWTEIEAAGTTAVSGVDACEAKRMLAVCFRPVFSP